MKHLFDNSGFEVIDLAIDAASKKGVGILQHHDTSTLYRFGQKLIPNRARDSSGTQLWSIVAPLLDAKLCILAFMFERRLVQCLLRFLLLPVNCNRKYKVKSSYSRLQGK